MRGLLWLIGLFALAAGLAVAGRYNEGYALLVWPPYRIQISLNLLILLLVGQLMALGSGYYWGLLGAAALFVYQQRLIRERQREACFQAFLNNNYVGALVLLGVIAHYL